MRAIPGTYGLYSADDDGSIWRNDRRLKACDRGNGYLCVRLSVHGVAKQYSVHTLIALTFHGPCPDGQEVRHLNGIKSDNRAANLAYGTKAQNTADKAAHGRPHQGETHPRAKLTQAEVDRIKAWPRYRRGLYAQFPQVSKAAIDNIRSGYTWNNTSIGEV